MNSPRVRGQCKGDRKGPAGVIQIQIQIQKLPDRSDPDLAAVGEEQLAEAVRADAESRLPVRSPGK